MEHESLFKTKVLNKLKMDTKSRSSKCSAAKFLYESFGDSANDYYFVCWLAKLLELKPCRFKEIVKNAHREFAPRHSLSLSSHQSIYNFWLRKRTLLYQTTVETDAVLLESQKHYTFVNMETSLTQILKKKMLF